MSNFSLEVGGMVLLAMKNIRNSQQSGGVPVLLQPLSSQVTTSAMPNMASAASFNGYALVTDGTKAYCFGGQSAITRGTGVTEAFALNLADGTWAQLAPMTYPKINMFGVLIPGGQILLAGNHVECFVF